MFALEDETEINKKHNILLIQKHQNTTNPADNYEL